MADIQFEEEQQYQRYGQAEQKPFLIRLVLATHIVSTDDAAKYVLVGISAFLILLAFLIPSFFGGSQPRVPNSLIDATTPPSSQRPSP